MAALVSFVNGGFGELFDEGRHGHFDVEFYHVGDGVELDVDDLVGEGH